MTKIAKLAKLDEVPVDKPSIVDSSAGTGKTHFLENLIVDSIITRKLQPNQVLLLTFAKAAADDLRYRVARAIERILNGDAKAPAAGEPSWDVTPDVEARLKRALLTLDECAIGTIHSFCNRVLGEQTFAIGLPPNLVPDLDDTAVDVSIREALRRDFQTRPELAPYYDLWRKDQHSSPEKLLSALAKLAKNPRPIRPIHRLDFTLDLLRQACAIKLKPAECVAMVAEVKAALDELVADPTIEQVLTTRDAVARAVTELVREQLETKTVKLPPGQPGRLLALALRLALETAPTRSAYLQEFAKCVLGRVEAIRWRDGGITYNDMIALVDQAGSGSGWPELAARLRRTYKLGLLDEFQDTDGHQWNIFRRLFLEGVGLPNLCTVGDPKQSIYSFRGANIHTYFGAKTATTKAGGKVLTLDENHRASQRMVDACNVLFGKKPTFFSSPLEYEEVKCGNPKIRATRDGVDLTPVVIGQMPSKSSEGLNDKIIARDSGRWIADEISLLLETGVTAFDDGKDRKDDPLAYGDVMVLTFKNYERREVQRYLTQRGIPSIIDGGDNKLFGTEEAKDVLHLLLAIDSPFDPRMYRQAWLTPFFEIPIERLQVIAGRAEEQKLQDRLTAWRTLAESRQFHKMFCSILSATGIIWKDLERERSERGLTNYLHVFELLRQRAKETGCGLDGLTEYLANGGGEEEENESESASPKERRFSDRNAVRIMTVHRSKGLQSPVVFVYGGIKTETRFSLEVGVENDEQVWHIAPEPWLVEQIAKERVAEWQRQIYVAMTRAQVRLYIPHPMKWNDKKEHNGQMRLMYHRIEALRAKYLSAPLFEMTDVEMHPVGWPKITHSKLKKAAPAKGTAKVTFGPDVNVKHPLDSLAGHQPTFVTSYTSISKKAAMEREEPKGGEDEDDDIETDESAAAAKPDRSILRGKDFGVFVHELIERAPRGTFFPGEDYKTWATKPEIKDLLAEIGERYDAEGKRQGAQLAHAAMTTAIPLPDGDVLAGIHTVKDALPEVRMLFPYVDPQVAGSTGFVTGSLDYVFLHKGKVYFADWKTNLLLTPGDAALLEEFKGYEIQAKLYTMALVKALRIKTEEQYERLIGGYLYCFVRRMAENITPGVHAGRLPWKELHP